MKGSVLKERRELAEDGVLIVSVVLDAEGRLAGEIHVESRGFIHTSDATDLYQEILRAVAKAVESLGEKATQDPEQLESRISGKVREIVRRTTRATPSVIPMITVLGKKQANPGFLPTGQQPEKE